MSAVHCYRDPDPFVSETLDEQIEAAELCFHCPVADACDQLGQGEDFGVYAGRLCSTDAERKLFRAANRQAFNRGLRCRNGHDLGTPEDPTENRIPLAGVFPAETNIPKVGCRRCRELRDEIHRAAATMWEPL